MVTPNNSHWSSREVGSPKFLVYIFFICYLHVRDMPVWRNSITEMRIICNQWLPILSMLPTDSPIVACSHCVVSQLFFFFLWSQCCFLLPLLVENMVFRRFRFSFSLTVSAVAGGFFFKLSLLLQLKVADDWGCEIFENLSTNIWIEEFYKGRIINDHWKVIVDELLLPPARYHEMHELWDEQGMNLRPGFKFLSKNLKLYGKNCCWWHKVVDAVNIALQHTVSVLELRYVLHIIVSLLSKANVSNCFVKIQCLRSKHLTESALSKHSHVVHLP